MSGNKFIDPRLQAREQMFQQLHLSTFDTMGYVRNVQAQVELSGQDIDSSHPDYQQLLRDYEITRNLADIEQPPFNVLCKQTDSMLSLTEQAFANRAQLCAAATSTLNHWRILCEIPEDLRNNDEVTKSLNEKFEHFLATWRHIVIDLSV